MRTSNKQVMEMGKTMFMAKLKDSAVNGIAMRKA